MSNINSNISFYVPAVQFKAGDFMYLNPEIMISAGLCNVSRTASWAASNSNALSNYFWNLDVIPNNFDPSVFLANSSNLLNISQLNQSIYDAMLLEGMNSNDILKRSSFPTTIGKTIRYFGSNASGNILDIGDVSSNLIQEGDVVKLRGSSSTIYAKFVSASNSLGIFNNIQNTRFRDATYVLTGIKVYDERRLAIINYIRQYSSNPTTPIINYYQDTKFNPDLYKLLYADSRNLSDRDAFIQYTEMASNNTQRIGKVEDIPACNLLQNYFENVSIAQELNVTAPTSSIRFRDGIVYGISTDDVTDSSILYPSQGFSKLITEYAIKSYIDRPYATLATFCNAIFNGAVYFNGYVMYEGIEVNNLKVNSNASCCNISTSNLSVKDVSVLGDVAYVKRLAIW